MGRRNWVARDDGSDDPRANFDAVVLGVRADAARIPVPHDPPEKPLRPVARRPVVRCGPDTGMDLRAVSHRDAGKPQLVEEAAGGDLDPVCRSIDSVDPPLLIVRPHPGEPSLLYQDQ